MVKGLKIEDELETATSNKIEYESDTTDSIEQLDSEEPNYLKAKRTKGQQKRRQHLDSKVVRKSCTSSQDDRKGRGARNQTGRGARARKSQMQNHEESQVELDGER